MRLRQGVALFIVALVFSACTLRRPEITLTLVSIDTRTPEATAIRELPTRTRVLRDQPTPTKNFTLTVTPAPSQSATAKPSDTDSPTASDTPTSTSTATAVVTEKPTATNTSAPTRKPSPTRILPRTATSTATATESQLTSEPQSVEETAPTTTVSAAATSLDLFPPTFTPLPTLNQTEIAALLATPRPRPTLPATWTAVPTLLPTNTIAAPPAQATAPVLIASPNVGPFLLSTPILSTPQWQYGGATLTPSPTATLFQPTVAVRPELLRPPIPPPVAQPTTFNTIGASAYLYNVGQWQVFTFENLQLQGGVKLFLPNPTAPDSFLRTDYRGQLLYKPKGVAQEGEMTYSPYFPGYSVPSIEENKNRIVELDWSADGERFSFRIDPPQGLDNSNAGVWFWQPYIDPVHGATYQLIRDCAAENYRPCDFVTPSSAKYWKTIGVQWSPVSGRNTVLLTLHLPEEGRNALAIAQAELDPKYADNAPPFVRYDYGYWNPAGQGITVSGRRPDGLVIIGEVNNDLSGERVIFNASSWGLWLRDAVSLPTGGYRALGRPGTPGSGPLALYDGEGNQLSAFIGNAAPEEVRWYPDRSAVVLTVEGRQYTVQVAGAAVTDSSNLANNPQFSRDTFGPGQIPSAVVIGNEYYPGQQLRTIVGSLNVRQSPSTSSQVISWLVAGDYVAIIAGPYENEGYRWWQVQTARNVVGWIAGTIGGNPTIRSPFY